MKKKSTKLIVIPAGFILCAVLAVMVFTQLRTETPTDTLPPSPDNQTEDVTVNRPGSNPNTASEGNEISNPGDGAISEGTDQTIQADPIKPTPPPTPKIKNEDEYKNSDVQPTYAPEQEVITQPSSTSTPPDTNAEGQVYFPGFGYITPSGEGHTDHASDMYENGNKVGTM